MENPKQNIEAVNSSASVINKLLKSVKWLVLFVIGLYSLVWMTSPLIANYVLGDILSEDFNLQLSNDTSIRYNPFTSHLSIRDLKIYDDIQTEPKHAPSDFVNKPDETLVFSLSQFDVEVRLHRILADELYVSELTLNGLFVAIEQSKQGFIVAGINLQQQANEQELGVKTEPVSSSIDDTEIQVFAEKNESIYSMVLPKGLIQNIKTEISLIEGNHTIAIDKLELSRVAMSEIQQQLSSHFEISLNSAPLIIGLNANLNEGIGTIELALDLKEFELSTLQSELAPHFDKVAGKVSIFNRQFIELSGKEIVIQSPAFQLNTSAIALTNSEIDFSFKEQSLTVSKISAGLNYSDNTLQLKQPVSVDNILFELSDAAGRAAESHFISQKQAVEVEQLTIESSAETNHSLSNLTTRIDSLRYQPEGMKYEDPSQSFLTNAFALTVSGIFLDRHVNAIDQIIVDGIDATFKLKPAQVLEETEKELDNGAQSLVESSKEQGDSELSNEDPTDVSSQVAVRLGQFELINSEKIQFVDESISPSFSRSLVIESAKLTSLDSSQPSLASQFILTGKSDQYTQFNFEGAVKPFTDKINLELQGTLNEFSLPSASSYIQSLLGFEIESGELDTELEIKIVESQIEGETGIKIRGLALASAENYDQGVIQEQTAMPLNMALGMLKDSDDNVELDIPIFGDLDSPTFGVGSFVSLITKEAIQSAAKSYLITTFLPYSDVISMTISAGEFIMKTRFEDLIYQPGQHEISESQEKYFDQFVALMKDKESTQVKVCGIATSADLPESLQVDTKTPEVQNEINKNLKNVALKRMNLFKESAVARGIESARVLLCSPKIDLSKDSQPRLVLSV